MKDTFQKDTKSLLEEQLDATLSEHKPYMVIHIGSTGKDDEDIATRICCITYTYNKKTKQYEEGSKFKEMLMPPQEYIDIIQTPDSVKGTSIRQMLRRGQIDIDAYCKGTGSLSKEEFKKAYAYFMKGASKCGLVFINTKSYIRYMEKIDAADEIHALSNKLILFEQSELTSLVYPNAPGNSLNDIALYAFHNANISTPERKIAMISDVVRVYGEGGRILTPNADSFVNTVLAKEALAEKGRLKYQNATLEDKFDTLLGNVKSGIQILEPVTAYIKGMAYPDIYTPQTDRLKEVLDTKKGFSVMMVSTSGTGPTVHNQPIHMTVIPYRFRDGKCESVRDKGFDCMIGCNEAEILEAKNLADKGKYDVFKRGNIDYNAYVEASLAGNLASATQVANKLAEYTKEFPLEDYPLVSASTDAYKGKVVLFTQGALLNMIGLSDEDGKKANEIFTSIPGFTSILGNIDFSALSKEILYNKFTNKEDFGDRFCNLSTWTEPDMSLECFAHHKYPNIEINGTERKCCFIGRMIEAYAMDRASFLRDGQKTVLPSEKPDEPNDNKPDDGSGGSSAPCGAKEIPKEKKTLEAHAPKKPLLHLEPAERTTPDFRPKRTLVPKAKTSEATGYFAAQPAASVSGIAPAAAPKTEQKMTSKTETRENEAPASNNLEKILLDMAKAISDLNSQVASLTSKVTLLEENAATKKELTTKNSEKEPNLG